MAGPDAQKRANLVVSRIIPPVLLGIVVYASYAITKPLCSEYFICLEKQPAQRGFPPGYFISPA
jgi:hypothetical protein